MANDKRVDLSRRSLLKTSLASAALISALPSRAFGASLSTTSSSAASSNPLACNVGFDFASFTVNGQLISTQSSSSSSAALAAEHKIVANLYTANSYANGANGTEQRSLLTIDVGPDPLNTTTPNYHPMDAGGIGADHSITDIYVFSQADNSLLFWRKLGMDEVAPAAMMVVPQTVIGKKVTIVARCSIHGYWGLNFDLGSAAQAYSTAVGTYNSSLLCGGATIARPYTAPDATGGQGDLTVLHRPNLIMNSASQVTVFLGGDLTGNGKHPRFATNHYIMGGMLFDQDGNVIGVPQTIMYAAATDQQLTFSNLNLAGVTTIRTVLFDALQGRLMGFYDVV